MIARLLFILPAIVLGGSVLFTVCGITPEEEEALAVQALNQMDIAATTVDEKMYRIEGAMDNDKFHAALTHITTLHTRHQLSIDFNGAEFTDLAALSRFSNLQSLDLSSNSSLTDLRSLPSLPGLQKLNLSSDDQLTDFTGLSNAPNLKSLNLYKTTFTDFEALSHLAGLETLDLSYHANLESFTGFPRLTNLKSLNLSYNDALRDLTELSNFTGLLTLDLSYTSAITDLMPLSRLPRLQSLNLYNSSLSPKQINALQQAKPGLTIEK